MPINKRSHTSDGEHNSDWLHLMKSQISYFTTSCTLQGCSEVWPNKDAVHSTDTATKNKRNRHSSGITNINCFMLSSLRRVQRESKKNFTHMMRVAKLDTVGDCAVPNDPKACSVPDIHLKDGIISCEYQQKDKTVNFVKLGKLHKKKGSILSTKQNNILTPRKTASLARTDNWVTASSYSESSRCQEQVQQSPLLEKYVSVLDLTEDDVADNQTTQSTGLCHDPDELLGDLLLCEINTQEERRDVLEPAVGHSRNSSSDLSSRLKLPEKKLCSKPVLLLRKANLKSGENGQFCSTSPGSSGRETDQIIFLSDYESDVDSEIIQLEDDESVIIISSESEDDQEDGCGGSGDYSVHSGQGRDLGQTSLKDNLDSSDHQHLSYTENADNDYTKFRDHDQGYTENMDSNYSKSSDHHHQSYMDHTDDQEHHYDDKVISQSTISGHIVNQVDDDEDEEDDDGDDVVFTEIQLVDPLVLETVDASGKKNHLASETINNNNDHKWVTEHVTDIVQTTAEEMLPSKNHQQKITNPFIQIGCSQDGAETNSSPSDTIAMACSSCLPEYTTTFTHTKDPVVSLTGVPGEVLITELKKRHRYFSCVCGASFLEEQLFKDHQICHTPGNPMLCTCCHQQFSDGFDFNQHLLLHLCRV